LSTTTTIVGEHQLALALPLAMASPTESAAMQWWLAITTAVTATDKSKLLQKIMRKVRRTNNTQT
jgi:hypothetical protein